MQPAGHSNACSPHLLQVLHVNAVQDHRPLSSVIQPHEQAEDGGLPTPAAAHDCHALPWRSPQADPTQHFSWSWLPPRVGEADILHEGDESACSEVCVMAVWTHKLTPVHEKCALCSCTCVRSSQHTIRCDAATLQLLLCISCLSWRTEHTPAGMRGECSWCDGAEMSMLQQLAAFTGQVVCRSEAHLAAKQEVAWLLCSSRGDGSHPATQVCSQASHADHKQLCCGTVTQLGSAGVTGPAACQYAHGLLPRQSCLRCCISFKAPAGAFQHMQSARRGGHSCANKAASGASTASCLPSGTFDLRLPSKLTGPAYRACLPLHQLTEVPDPPGV